MSLHSEAFLGLQANQSLAFFLSENAANNNFIVLSLTCPGIETTIYHDRTLQNDAIDYTIEVYIDIYTVIFSSLTLTYNVTYM